jgi:hypothetical protein
MNLKNILWVRNTGKIVPDAPIADNLLGLKLGGGGVITTATGNPVSIVTNKAQNAISTILSFSPKQSGTGDPSPTNVRPITGFNSITLTVNCTDVTISLGGTYYGGVLDVTTGTLAVDRAIYTFTGSEVNYAQQTGRVAIKTSLTMKSGSAMCDHFATVVSGASNWFYIKTTMTAEDLKTYMQNNTVHVVYLLSKPITYTLTPQTVALLKGNNTLWTDGDEISITYKAKK